MTGLVAYVALVVVLPALLLGHQGQDFPLRGAWRRLSRAHSPSPVSGATEPATEPPRARTAPRPAPSWAHVQPLDYEEAA